MMSALVMGMLLMLIKIVRGRRFMEKKPMAASVPNTVEISVASTAIASVTPKALMIASLCRRSAYQCSVKPDQTARFLESLNEKITSTRIGAYRKI